MKYKITDKPESAHITLTEHQGERDGLILCDVDVVFDQPTTPNPIHIIFDLPNRGIYSTFSANNGFDCSIHSNWYHKTVSSSINGGSPLCAFLTSNGRNLLTFTHSEMIRPFVFYYGNNEFTKGLDLDISLFHYMPGVVKEYHVTLYFDFADKRYEDAVRDATHFWTDTCHQTPCYIPDAARRPLYSCWYTFHQAANPEEIVRQCEIAKSLGMGTVILDDGWQNEDCNGGYRTVGDWEVCEKKIPDMAELVRSVHKTGMKFMLWYYFAGAGADSKVRKKFADKLLNPWNEQCAELDVRYPEVREYLLDKYRRAILDWDLDGFKLDFVDAVYPQPDTPAPNDQMDFDSVEPALDHLLSEICSMAKSIKPDFLIEFRQCYFGPAMQKHMTMVRVGDCANDSYRNRVFGTDMRLSLITTPVHSDMLMWNFDVPVEDVAMQVISTLFEVPQISVKLDELPESHRKMLAFYLGFHNEHNDTLQKGKFEADNPESHYGQLRATLGDETIAVAYSKTVLEADGHIFFINGSDGEELLVKSTKASQRNWTVYDCMGNIISQGVLILSDDGPSYNAFPVPRSGMLEIG